MKTISKDLDNPLDEIERDWIRIPVTLMLTIPVFVIMVVVGMILGAAEGVHYWWMFVAECLKGPDAKES